MMQITQHGLDGVDDAMAIMRCAFDPQYGETWSAAQCAGVLAMPGAVLLLARKPQPIGFALLRTVLEEAELMLLAVEPNARRDGIGRALLDRSFAVAQTAGAKHYFLEVRSDNPAVEFYERAGLLRVGIRRDYYRGPAGQHRDALTYRLSLR
jgi:[ribosomal protein S18]-alanine N-acetyltransferase